jgi:hypothetical protein
LKFSISSLTAQLNLQMFFRAWAMRAAISNANASQSGREDSLARDDLCEFRDERVPGHWPREHREVLSKQLEVP